MIAIGVTKSLSLIARVAEKPLYPRLGYGTYALQAYLHIRVLLTRVANKEKKQRGEERKKNGKREEERNAFIVSASRNFRGCTRTHERGTLKKNAHVISAAWLCESCGPSRGRSTSDARCRANRKSLATHGRVPATCNP